jgi:hypothetical protein
MACEWGFGRRPDEDPNHQADRIGLDIGDPHAAVSWRMQQQAAMPTAVSLSLIREPHTVQPGLVSLPHLLLPHSCALCAG